MLTVDFELLETKAGMMVLDVGCGQGRHSLEFLRRDCRVAAMDLKFPDLKYTRYLLTALGNELKNEVKKEVKKEVKPDKKAGEGGHPLFLVAAGDALGLPFPSDTFDRIICSEVLEHVDDPGGAVTELARVLKPGGLLAVSVPTPFTERAYGFATDEYFNTPGGHVRICRPRQLAGLLREKGLLVRDISWAHSFHSLYWWIRCIFGLHDEQHPVIRHCKKILTYQLFSPQLLWIEKVCDRLFPKSVVLYGGKPE